MPPMILMLLPFRRYATEGGNLLSWAIDTVEEAFLGRFFGRAILSVGIQISMKILVCGSDFSSQMIGRSILNISNT